MNLSLKNETPARLTEWRRCRPLLGTFVEVAVGHEDRGQAYAAIDVAFAAIERVHKLMSFHDPESDVSRLNRLAAYQSVPVSFETFRVLQCAKELHERTHGIFDITVASELMKEGLLPRHPFCNKNEGGARASNIELLSDGHVRFRCPLAIDLGGIAKGFAVDQAVNALQNQGMICGLVNAGGDLRCFGERENPAWVRHPRISGQLLPLIVLKNAALATSCNSGSICAHIHGQTRKPLMQPFSVSVRTRTCMIADALTKVVLALKKESTSVLFELDAAAFIVYPDDRLFIAKGKQNER